jgi:hypothetical protein
VSNPRSSSSISSIATGRPAPRQGPRTRAAVGIALLTVLSACGASINAIYESDVRFEQCMALDSRADVKPTLRRGCWHEWLNFYTFGQTRDRVEWARGRIRQLRADSDFIVEGEAEESTASLAVPEPTSVMAPPPMMLVVDAGAAPSPPQPTADQADGGGPLADSGAPVDPASAACTAECDEAQVFCRQECSTPACEKTCAGKHKRCMRRCF